MNIMHTKATVRLTNVSGRSLRALWKKVDWSIDFIAVPVSCDANLIHRIKDLKSEGRRRNIPTVNLFTVLECKIGR